MCGIVGVLSWDRPVEPDLLRRMNNALRHRGPDDEGYYTAPGVGLGVRRLSIIDVAGGHQPIGNEDRSQWIVFNGEIFNYAELRIELERHGHALYTHTDTEVIVHLYEELGPRCLDRLNGMFAFAIWDQARRELFVARDRLGVKPLYYWSGAGQFVFASELKALLLHPDVRRTLDLQAVADYLTFMYVPGPKTPFRDIRKLLPGHYLVLGRNGLTVKRYWSLTDHATPLGISFEEAKSRVRELLDDAVRLRLRSDVPVGAFLSGGMDSSSVVALASRHLAAPLATFSVGFTADGIDELPYAREVAMACRADHHEIQVDPDQVVQLLPRLVWHMDEPSGDSAFIPTYLVSRLAAERVSVILSGLGGDELFAGYHRYRQPIEPVSRKVSAYNLLPASVRRGLLVPIASRLSPGFGARLASAEIGPGAERYENSVTIFSRADKAWLLGRNGWEDPGEIKAHYSAYPARDAVNRLLSIDAHTYLPDDILSLTDRMSMAVSLEARTPFLDYRLVEFCAGLPGSFKLSRTAWKIILKDAMAPLLPRATLERGKWGFGAPVSSWLSRRLLPYARRLLSRGVLTGDGVLLPGAVEGAIREFEADGGQGQRLWTLVILELWARIYLGGSADHAPDCTLDDLVEATA